MSAHLAMVAMAAVAHFGNPGTPPMPWTAAQVQTAVQVADAHWPGSPCQGRESIQWVDSKSAVPGPYADGYAYPSTCLAVLVEDNLNADDPATVCAVAEHEFGHLAGLGHSPDPADVMFPTQGLTPDCVAAFPPPPPGDVCPAKLPPDVGEIDIPTYPTNALTLTPAGWLRVTKLKRCAYPHRR